ncbi:MAG TPA: hypothetical protein VER79_06050 [Candidatus Limnocylindrales bacterium]|nr:hypothetical protein [Candidatus Limnocylindrales bacterium]
MTESHPGWIAVEDGATVDHTGSEGGVIWKDEEHADGARITLERNSLMGAPFALTCGIYGWMVHTRFFADEPTALAQYDAMKPVLAEIAGLVISERSSEAADAIDVFAATFP